MRIVVFGRTQRLTRTSEIIAAAFRELGHDVRMVHYGRWTERLGRRLGDALLGAAMRRFRPEFVLVWKTCISPALLRRLTQGCKSAVYCVDWFQELPEDLCELARIADLFLLTNRGQLDLYRRHGARRPATWLQAFDPKTHVAREPAPAGMRCDVAFIGRPGVPARRELLARVDAEFDLKIWGLRWEELADRYRGVQQRSIVPEQYPLVCRAAKVILGRDATIDVDLYFSDRLWLTLGSGGFLVTNYVPGLEELFENHKHLVWYRSPDECVEQIRHYLPRDEERLRIAEAGRDLVVRNHTYVHRARELLQMLAAVPQKAAQGGTAG